MIMVFVRKCHPAASRAAHTFKEIPGHVEVSIDDNDCVDVDEKKKNYDDDDENKTIKDRDISLLTI